MSAGRIIFGLPWFDEREEQLVLETLRSGWIGQGPLVARFERALGAYLGAGHVVTVSSCTAAMHLCLRALDVGPGDEVITTPFTFVATVNAIEHAGATPVLVDPDRTSLNLTPEAVAAAVALVPADWLADAAPHAEYLTRRLAAPRLFVEEAERARRGA